MAAVSTTAALITVAYHVLYRVFEDYLLNPRVLRKTVDVSPLVTSVAVLLGGSLLGVTGALIASPGAAAVQLAWVSCCSATHVIWGCPRRGFRSVRWWRRVGGRALR